MMLTEPTSLNRGEGLVIKWMGKFGSVEGEDKGEGEGEDVSSGGGGGG